MKNRYGLMLLPLIIWCAWIAAPHNIYANDDDLTWVSKIISAQGQIYVKRAGGTDWQPATLNDTFYPGDTVRVDTNSRAGFLFNNESILRVDQHTTLVFTGIEKKKTFLLQMIEGAAYFFSRKSRSLKVSTPFVNGVVEGTEFLVRVDQEQSEITLYEGRVLAENSQGQITMAKGQRVSATQDHPPQLQTVVRPRDAVQWALYYPPIITFDKEFFPETDPDHWTTRLHRAIQAREQGDDLKALAAIEKLNNTIDDARPFVYRAGLLLSLGRIGEAEQDIARALTLDDKNSTAMALLAIIAVVQNRKEDALHDAQQAVHLNPKSAAARLALSYALQAHFQLQAALEAAQIVVQLEPRNGLAWARLAELHLSTGDLDSALAAAKNAATAAPHLAHIQTILGFAYLTQIRIQIAQATFTQAIDLDSTAPLPRIGLGLALIRQGDLEAGRGQIEIAVALDPDNALLRSYLGKAYFDEKRAPLDERQFEMAKTLDPMDPTPWFYDAIRKQSLNRPGEALIDLQHSINLNDNRAVYRSKFLLDQDLAARSASLARIYDNLGFAHEARVKATRSLSKTPSSYSPHRFLADSYGNRDSGGQEIARVSEQLQSQLLQPININPIPPSLIETDLNTLNRGAIDIGFNEYYSLFEHNRMQVLASGAWGNNGTWDDEITFAGLYNRFSLSTGQFHYQTDGFRPNNDIDHDIYTFFTQVAVTPQLSVQAEWRRRITDQGDIVLNFDPEDYSDGKRLKMERDTLRLGTRASISNTSSLIASVIFKNEKGELFQSPPSKADTIITIDQDRTEDGHIAELQYLYQIDIFNLITGTGISDINGDGESVVDMVPRNAPYFPIETDQSFDTKHLNSYLYTNIVYPHNITWTLGASFDSYEDQQIDRQTWNPKFGLQWELFTGLTIRASAFKTMKKILVLNQTIEPTQIAGFNQFFDDFAGTQTRNYGIGLDYRLSSKLFAGFEIKLRELEVPQENDEFTADWSERQYELSLNYLFDNTSIKLAPSFEYFDRNQSQVSNINIPERTETVKIPFTVNWSCPSGFFTKLTSTYVYQKIESPEVSSFSFDEDDFILVDLSIGYRLPDRIGTIHIEGRNIFNEEFYYQDNNFRTSDQQISDFVPNVSILGRVTLFF